MVLTRRVFLNKADTKPLMSRGVRLSSEEKQLVVTIKGPQGHKSNFFNDQLDKKNTLEKMTRDFAC